MKPDSKLKHQKMTGNYDIFALPLPTPMTSPHTRPPPKKKRLKTKRVLPCKLLCKNWLII